MERIGQAPRFVPPVRGWTRAVREGLGLTTAQLASRLGVKQPSVVAMEQSEQKETIALATLRRAAAAMDCDLVYALVPRKPLETMVRERALRYMLNRRGPIAHTMLLEDQAVLGKDLEAELDEVMRETNPSRFWD